MPEAEDVITDAARHATVFVQDLWRRHRPAPAPVDVPQLLRRLELILAGSFAKEFTLRLAQPPAPVPFVRRMFLRDELPRVREAIPATDGHSIWLPLTAEKESIETLQIMALQQAARAVRDAPAHLADIPDPIERAVFEVLEANAADAELARAFPGLAVRVERFRHTCLQLRPAVKTFPLAGRALEAWVHRVLQAPPPNDESCDSMESRIEHAQEVARGLHRGSSASALRGGCLFRDRWVGELREPPEQPATMRTSSGASRDTGQAPPRSARMSRRPDVRKPDARDEATAQGAWMVQTSQPHEHAEDPFGMQRPTDRDEHQAADEFADSLSELSEARLVSTPGAPKEILLSDDLPPGAARESTVSTSSSAEVLQYPEWDWRARGYREPGASVHILPATLGPREWVDATLEEHRALLQAVKRQFEALRAQRMRLRQQADGDDLDLEACVETFADTRAGVASERGLYQCTRTARRELAVLLLIDVSGSTDSWVSHHRRVIDVEREALFIVCRALEGLGEPYSVLAFSGESIAGVTVRSVKSFRESLEAAVELRIAGLEPEKYTRAGAAIRHASSLLMEESARHRLLLLLSDGKPNDMDEYDGRYGVEDMRQAVVEARLQGISPFCLTIDRQTANYLPAVFGEHHYAVLHRPELLPTALLGWLQRLVKA